MKKLTAFIKHHPQGFLLGVRLPIIIYASIILNAFYFDVTRKLNTSPKISISLLFILIGVGIGYLVSTIIKKSIDKSKKSEETASKDDIDSFTIPIDGQQPLVLNNIFNGMMIVGQPGSGKTASAIHPLLYQVVEKDWTGLIYDLKGKLADEVISCYDSIKDKSTRETQIKFVNFSNPLKSQRINPIHPDYITNKADVIEFAGTLLSNLMSTDGSKTEDPFWFNNAKNIFSANVWYLKNNYPEFCTIPHAIALTYWQDPEQLIEKLQSDPECSRMLATLNASSQSQDKKLFINIISTLYTHLMALDLPELFFTLSGNEVNLNVNSQENPTLLTIANYEPLQKVYSPIIAVICNVVCQRMNEDGKRKGVIMFDEFASIKIPNFERTPETIRSRGVATIIALQDKQQLITKYGDSIAETIASTLATKFYFKSTNSKTVEEAVKIFGKRDVRYKTKTTASGSFAHRLASTMAGGKSSDPTQSESVQERDYLRIDEITNYDRGQFAGIYSDANIKFSKGNRIKLVKLEQRSTVQGRTDFTKEDIQKMYRQVYDDIESIFYSDSSNKKHHADVKIDFD